MAVTPSTVWSARTPDEIATLRADIKANGIENPVLLMADGETIIDGHHRKSIAVELGIDYPIRVRHDVITTDQAIALAVERNGGARAPRGEHLDAIIAALHREGWSNRRIAIKLGVSHATVNRHFPTGTSDPVGQTEGVDGKRRPSKRPNRDEIERRRDVVAALARDGFKYEPIRQAVGVGKGTLTADLAARGIRMHGTRVDDIPPERAFWRDGDPRAKQPRKRRQKLEPPPPSPEIRRWQITPVFTYLDLFHAAFIDGDFANQLAHAVEEAVIDGADEWMSERRELLRRVFDEVGRLAEIFDDEKYRRRCSSTEEGREALRRPLRAIP